RPDALDACAELLVNQDSTVDREPRLLRQPELRPDAHADYDELGVDLAPVPERHSRRSDARDALLEVEVHTMLLVQCADKTAALFPENRLHRDWLGCDDVHLDVACPQ